MAAGVKTYWVHIYANLVINGVKTIADLPAIYQEPVQTYINSMNA